jgi:glycosyltransferase involved in cell wall biosynthesis
MGSVFHSIERGRMGSERRSSALRGDQTTPTIMFVLPGIDAGGSENVVHRLANHWVSGGWRVIVATFADDATPSYYPYRPEVVLDRLGFPPTRTSPLGAIRPTLQRVAALRRAIRRHRPALVISFLTRTNILTLAAGVGLATPIVVSERNNPAMQPIGYLWRLFRGLLYPRAFGLVTMTAGARDYFPPHMRKRTWVIPNMIEPAPAEGPRTSGRLLTAVGRLVPQKGFDLLLEAFARIAPHRPGWLLMIWGDGPERAALEARRDRLGLTDRVLMPGVSRTPGSWIETADIFVLSSRYEGWGIVLLEAMAAGLPVVSFDCQWGPHEMISDEVDGLMVPREDVPALATALDRMMGDPALRQRLGTAARQSSKRFMTDQILGQWDEVVRAAMGYQPAGQSDMVSSTSLKSI